MTTAERIAALRNKNNKSAGESIEQSIQSPAIVVSNDNTITQGTPELNTDGNTLVSNLQRAYEQHGESLPDAEPTLPEQNELGTIGIEDSRTEYEQFHGKFGEIGETDSHQLFHLINSPRLAREFGVTDMEIYVRAYNLEIIKVASMDLGQIHDRIETLQKLVKANNAMQQACKEMQVKKEKEFRDSLIGLPRDEAERRLRQHEDEKWDRENKDKIAKRRKEIKTDETGAIVEKSRKKLTDKEKMVKKLMKLMNCDEETAIKMIG